MKTIKMDESTMDRYVDVQQFINGWYPHNEYDPGYEKDKAIYESLRSSFDKCWSNLTMWLANSPKDYTLYIYNDFVKHSFGFAIHDANNRRAVNGGFILHGYEETYSVELTSNSLPHFSIHT